MPTPVLPLKIVTRPVHVYPENAPAYTLRDAWDIVDATGKVVRSDVYPHKADDILARLSALTCVARFTDGQCRAAHTLSEGNNNVRRVRALLFKVPRSVTIEEVEAMIAAGAWLKAQDAAQVPA